jgi:hypothetical protein
MVAVWSIQPCDVYAGCGSYSSGMWFRPIPTPIGLGEGPKRKRTPRGPFFQVPGSKPRLQYWSIAFLVIRASEGMVFAMAMVIVTMVTVAAVVAVIVVIVAVFLVFLVVFVVLILLVMPVALAMLPFVMLVAGRRRRWRCAAVAD